ncbi:MAG: family 43 glycosylhydrolase [Clostridia bacterium]|nr:family 43 glycosylhydrolase [Clostridia bacterium]
MRLDTIHMRDPFMFVENGAGYLIGTTDNNCWYGKAGSFLGYKTNDLINFEGPYTLFEYSDSFWADENFWAPEMHKIGDKYFIFASFKSSKSRRCSQALVCDEPFGRYVPCGKPFTPEEWDCLDATYYEENGKKYTVFCHEWTQCADGQICLGELTRDLDGLKNVKTLFNASSAPWAVAFDGKNYVTDAPFITRLDGGRLLMTWSTNGAKGYNIGMSISDDGIAGPWRHLPEVLYGENGGHAMTFSFGGKKYIIYHYPNDPALEERAVIREIRSDEKRIYFADV